MPRNHTRNLAKLDDAEITANRNGFPRWRLR